MYIFMYFWATNFTSFQGQTIFEQKNSFHELGQRYVTEEVTIYQNWGGKGKKLFALYWFFQFMSLYTELLH